MTQASAAVKRPPKITLIIHWYGRLPAFSRLFFDSCAHNPDVDFLLFSDLLAAPSLPANVRFHHLPLGEFNALASRKTGLDVRVTDSYKLCDFRPAYGLIFEDYLEGADFWGSTDVDLILGSVRSSLAAVLDRHDVISVRKEWFSGSFSLYRNRPDVNNLFRESRDHARVLSAQEHFGFDECSRLVTPTGYQSAYIPLVNGVSIADLDTEVDSMTHVIARASVPVYRETLIAEGIEPGALLEYNNEVLSLHRRSGTSFPLHYHFVGEKILSSFRYPDWTVIPQRYFIDRTGFYTESQLRWRIPIAAFRRARGLVSQALSDPGRTVARLPSYLSERIARIA